MPVIASKNKNNQDAHLPAKSKRMVSGSPIANRINPPIKNHNHQLWIIRFSILALLSLCTIPVTVWANGPVVCASGAGNVSVDNLDLSTCGAPAGQPLYVVLRVKSPDVFGTAQARLREGSLNCNVTATVGGYADCAVTVSDGFLDRARTLNNPENYRLEVSWSSKTVAQSQEFRSVYTTTLLSGNVLDVYRSYTYGEIAIVIMATSIIIFLVWVVIKDLLVR